MHAIFDKQCLLNIDHKQRERDSFLCYRVIVIACALLYTAFISELHVTQQFFFYLHRKSDRSSYRNYYVQFVAILVQIQKKLDEYVEDIRLHA